ncbi:MAG: bacteriophage Gp15 family protein [Oscillospiraceae bacterium]|nr:bacteriophage Gp15 family protein [Oscillospiraceae bacterium]
MSILTDSPPDAVEISGRLCAIRTDFRIGIGFETMIQNRDTSDEEKVVRALQLYYPAVPADVPEAVEALLWFYRCGDTSSPEDKAGRESPPKAYDFDQDAALIYAAFLQYYGLDLSAERIHWWRFRALFAGLPDDCKMRQVMHYRTANLAGADKATKKRYKALRKFYAIKTAAGRISLQQRDAVMREYVAKRLDGGDGN